MGGLGLLPYMGGVADQPAGLMRCFDVMSGALSAIRARHRPTPPPKPGSRED